MAFIINNASGSNLLTMNRPSSVIPLSYTLNTSGTWIQTNFPEAIRADGFGDKTLGNRYLNQVTVTAGTHQIFYSHQDSHALGPYLFGIQIYNPNPTAIIFQKLNDSHRDSAKSGGWPQTNGGVWQDFFSSPASEKVSINAESSHWVRENSIPKGCIFTGNMRFTISNKAIVTLYVYKTKSAIDGTAGAYPWTTTDAQYSGYGAGYFYTAAPITLNASRLASGQYFLTNYRSGMTQLTIGGQPKTADTIPLVLATKQSITAPNGNLGNWAVQYQYPLKLVNDTNTAKTFEGYVRADSAASTDNWVVIQSGTDCKYASLGPSYGGVNSWKWLSKVVPANSAYTDTFQYILGTNSTEHFTHIFKAV